MNLLIIIVSLYIPLNVLAVDPSKFYQPFKNGTMTLRLVHAVWRHGDRSPTETFTSDHFQEDSWPFGGGGWGQLSPTGMYQHMQLGKKVRSRYVDDVYKDFLPKTYNSKAMYIRSTDINRTLLSAHSNMLGMYGQKSYGTAINMTDYPDLPGWPEGYVPIPIHTINDDFDHLIDVDNTCPFQDEVWGLAKTEPQVADFINQQNVQDLLGNLTVYCGMDVTVDNLWIVVTSLRIESLYYNDELHKYTKWYSEELFNQADAINDQIQLYQNGIFNSSGLKKGIDTSRTLKQIRGGSVLNEISDRMQQKLDCMKKNNKECKWINGLHYYIYSSHDTTIYALFSALGLEEYAVKPPGSYPLYSAAAFVELWTDENTGDPYFRLLYHRNASDDFAVETQGIPGCAQDSEYCPLKVWQDLAVTLKPTMPMNQWCHYSLDGSSTTKILTSTKSAGAISSILARTFIFMYILSSLLNF